MHEPSPLTKGPCCVFRCKQKEGSCHIFWFAWYENSGGFAINGTCGLFGVKWDFLLGCLHLDAICQLYCGRPGSILTWFYSKFVMGQIQELKVNMVIYLHAHKQAHFVRRFWWLLVWIFLVWLPGPGMQAAHIWQLHRGRWKYILLQIPTIHTLTCLDLFLYFTFVDM